MKKCSTIFLLRIIYLLLRIVPTKANQIVFYSAFDFSDNARGIYEYLKKSEMVTHYRVIWLVSDKSKYEKVCEPAVFYNHKSIKGLWGFLRSHYIVRTHSLFDNLYNPKKQVLINAFHGMPIKAVVTVDRAHDDFDNFSFFPTTAEVFSDIISRDFSMAINRFPVLGMARNDFLFEETDVIKILKLTGYKKIVLWMPTFRTSAIGNFSDGKQSEMGIPCVKRPDLIILNEKLKEENVLLLLKLHPWASSSVGDLSEYSNICNIKNEDIPYPYTLYHLVSQADVLFTDFSSIYIDFLLVNKPVAFVIDDFNEYKNSRGFAFEPIEDYLAGKIITKFDELVEYIGSMDKINLLYTEKRQHICNVFHAYRDNQSAKRTMEYLKKNEFMILGHE